MSEACNNNPNCTGVWGTTYAACCGYDPITNQCLTCPDVDGDSRVCCTGGIDVPSLHSCCDPATSRCGVDCTTFPALAPACASLEFINGDTACAISSGYYCTNPGIAPPAAGQASGGGNSTCCNVGMMCRGPTGYSVCCPGAGRTHTCGLDCVTNVPLCLPLDSPVSATSCPNNYTFVCATPGTLSSDNGLADSAQEAAVSSDVAIVGTSGANEECCATTHVCPVYDDYSRKLCCHEPQVGGRSCPVDCYTGDAVCHAPGSQPSASSCPTGSHLCLDLGGNNMACCPEDNVCTSSTGASVCCASGQSCGEDCRTGQPLCMSDTDANVAPNNAACALESSMQCVEGTCCSVATCELGINQCSCANGVHGTCGENCETGTVACLPNGFPPTNSSCPTKMAPIGSYTCAEDGVCCAADQLCDEQCCASNERCFTDCATSIQRCMPRATPPTGALCPTSATGDAPAAACVSDGSCCTSGAVCTGGSAVNTYSVCCAAGSTCAKDCASGSAPVCIDPDSPSPTGADSLDVCVEPYDCMPASGTGDLVCCRESSQCDGECCGSGVCSDHSGYPTCVQCPTYDTCATCANEGCAWCVIQGVCVNNATECGTRGSTGADTCAVTASPFVDYDDDYADDDDFNDDDNLNDDGSNSNECVKQSVSCCVNMTTVCDCTALSMCTWCAPDGVPAPPLMGSFAAVTAGGKCVPRTTCPSGVCPLNPQFHHVACGDGVGGLGIPWLLLSIGVGPPLLLWLLLLAMRSECKRTAHGPGTRGRCSVLSAMANRPLAGALQAWLEGYPAGKVRNEGQLVQLGHAWVCVRMWLATVILFLASALALAASVWYMAIFPAPAVILLGTTFVIRLLMLVNVMFPEATAFNLMLCFFAWGTNLSGIIVLVSVGVNLTTCAPVWIFALILACGGLQFLLCPVGAVVLKNTKVDGSNVRSLVATYKCYPLSSLGSCGCVRSTGTVPVSDWVASAAVSGAAGTVGCCACSRATLSPAQQAGYVQQLSPIPTRAASPVPRATRGGGLLLRRVATPDADASNGLDTPTATVAASPVVSSGGGKVDGKPPTSPPASPEQPATVRVGSTVATAAYAPFSATTAAAAPADPPAWQRASTAAADSGSGASPYMYSARAPSNAYAAPSYTTYGAPSGNGGSGNTGSSAYYQPHSSYTSSYATPSGGSGANTSTAYASGATSGGYGRPTAPMTYGQPSAGSSSQPYTTLPPYRYNRDDDEQAS